MANPIAKLNSDGQLISQVNLEINKDMPPIKVNNNSNLVPNLNADKVDGLNADSFLRTDADSAVALGKKLVINGKIEIAGTAGGLTPIPGELNLKPGGALRLGWFVIRTSGNLMYFEYSPQEYTQG